MGVEHVEFREALQELAKRAGVELVNAPSLPPEVDAHRNRLIELNELAADVLCQRPAQHGARSAPAGKCWSNAASRSRSRSASASASPPMAKRSAATSRQARSRSRHGGRSGALIERDGGGYRDRFRNRLLFPIRTREGRAVGFGGRALGDAIPKYLNSAAIGDLRQERAALRPRSGPGGHPPSRSGGDRRGLHGRHRRPSIRSRQRRRRHGHGGHRAADRTGEATQPQHRARPRRRRRRPGRDRSLVWRCSPARSIRN